MQHTSELLQTQESVHPFSRRHLIFAAATILYWSTLYIYVPILSPYLQDRGLSMGWIGFILGSYGLTQVITRLPLGMYSDVMSRRKPFLIAGMIAGLISCIFFMFPGTWGGPLAGRLMAGLCAATWVPFTVLYASYYPTNQTHQAMGTLSFLTIFGQLAGMSASGWLSSLGGWNYAFLCGIGIAAVGTIVASFIYEPKSVTLSQASKPSAENLVTNTQAPPVSRQKTVLKRVLRSSMLWKVSILSLFAHGILFITMFGFTPLQATELGAKGAQLTGIVIAFMVPHALVSLWTGRYLAPRFGTRKIMIIGFIAATIFTAAIPFSPNLYWLAVTQIFNGAAQALYFPLLLSLAIRNFAPTERATAMGLYQAVYSMGMFLGPYIAGALNSFGGLKIGFLFGSVLGLIAAFLSTNKELDS
ncbi:MFS transporter [Cohnella abietis]|uniref:Putative MFS-type transporter YxlH n=1 Tax=Cohnella abietis TaxID=2507935 RepID=A0A3T1D8E3_9BACL|nr:MFS transporter [Cohnella abietis]BBI34343.1 putative MFS-type transporter YxlH [Cohnella abietis]